MADDRIEIEIVLDDGSIQKGFGKVRKEGKDTAENLGSSFRNFAKSAVGNIAAIGAGFASFRGIQSVLDNMSALETAFAEIKTIIPDITQANDELRNSLIETSSLFGTSAKEQANAFYQIVSAGITDVTQANELLATANKLAIGGLTDVTTAVDVLTSVVNAYGSDVLDATTASDTLFGTVKLGKTRVEDLAASIGQIAPTASALGVSFQDVSGALAALTVKGISTSQAVTQLNSVFTAVLKKQDEAKALGPEVAKAFSLQALQAKGLTQFMGDLNGVLGGSEEKLTKLLGRAEGAKGILALAGDGFKTMATNINELNTATGATDAAFEQINMTLGQQVNVLTSTISNLFTKLANSSAGSLKEVVSLLTDFVVFVDTNIESIVKTIMSLVRTLGILYVSLKLGPRLFDGMARGSQRLMGELALLPTRIGLLKLKMQGLALSFKQMNFKKVVKGLKSIRPAAKIAALGVKALKLSVNLLKITVTFGLSLALDFLMEKFEEVKESMGGFSNVIRFTVLTARQSFNELILTVIDFISKAEKLPLIGSKIKKSFGGSFDAIKASAKAALADVDESFDKLAQNVFEKTTKVTFGAPRIAEKAVEAVAMTFAAAAPVVDESLNKLRDKVTKMQMAIAETSSQTLFKLTETNAELFASTAQMTEDQLNKTLVGLNTFKNTTLKIAKDISTAVNNGIGRGFSTAIQEATKAMMAGENALAAFAKGFIGVMGDLAIQIGTQLMIAGLGLEQLFSLNPAGSIIFGAALVAIGTIMKSFAGGGGASSSVPSSQDSVTSPVIDESLSDGLREPSSAVNVTIQGDIFDSDATGLRLADILKDQGFNNAVVS